MPTKNLTAAVIDRLPKPTKPEDIRDAQSKGLYLRCYPTGRKVWRIRYKYRRKACQLVLGEYPAHSVSDARKAVIDAREKLSEGLDPAGDVQRARAERQTTPTVQEFAGEYIERYAKPNKKTWREDQRILDRDVLPALGKLRLDEVHRRNIVALMDTINDRGAPIAAKQTYAVIRKMFNFAVERSVLDMTPAQNIKTPQGEARTVVLTDDAIQHFWAATAPYNTNNHALEMRPATRLAMRLLLITGQRSAEVAGLRLDELDLKNALWTLPSERTKNSLVHTVPLTRFAMATIEEAMHITDSDEFLFASNSESGHLSVYANVQAIERIFSGWVPRYWTHDLRRTVGTRISALGFNRLVRDKVLNHKDSTVGGIYDRHTYDREKRAALDAWADELNTIIGGTRHDKVVRLTTQ